MGTALHDKFAPAFANLALLDEDQEKYWVAVCGCIEDTFDAKLIPKKKNSVWYKKVRDQSLRLAELLANETPSDAIVYPKWRDQFSVVLSEAIDQFAGDLASDDLRHRSPELVAVLNKLPTAFILRTMAHMAEAHSMKEVLSHIEIEHQIKLPRKLGDSGELGAEHLLTKLLKRLNVQTFGNTHDVLIASLLDVTLSTITKRAYDAKWVAGVLLPEQKMRQKSTRIRAKKSTP